MGSRVVQWTTGNVGQRSVRAIVAHPDLELVGCYAWSPDKVGRDVGELCGIDPVGITATDDVDALLALRPDCVVYNPMWPDVDELVRILEAGVNVVTTAAFINGRGIGADRDRIVDACEQGGSVDLRDRHQPGFRRADRHRHGQHLRPHRQDHHRRGLRHHALRLAGDRAALRLRPTDRRPRAAGMAAQGTAVFGEAVAMVADALGIELDEIVCEAEYARTTEDVVMDSWTIAAGCVAGVAASWQGRVGDRTVVELNVRWRKGQTLDPTGRSRKATSSPSTAGPPCRSPSSTCPRRTSRPRPSPTSWCSG